MERRAASWGNVAHLGCGREIDHGFSGVGGEGALPLFGLGLVLHLRELLLRWLH
jgi:hypothetical protein